LQNVELLLFTHRNRNCIAIKFAYNFALKEYVKSFKGTSWSNSQRVYYVHYSENTKKEIIAHLKEGGYHVLEISNAKTVFKTEKTSKSSIQLAQLSLEKQHILKRYVSYLQGKRLSRSTVLVYSNFIDAFLRFHSRRPPHELNENDVRTYVEWAVKELKYAISTHRQIISAFKHFAYFYPICQINPE